MEDGRMEEAKRLRLVEPIAESRDALAALDRLARELAAERVRVEKLLASRSASRASEDRGSPK